MTDGPRILKQELIARTRVFQIEQLELKFANGSFRRYERLVGGKQGAVLIVPMLNPDTVLLIREYAAGTLNYQLGLPKGLIEEGEEPLQAANREIMEETGYGANHLTLLKLMTIVPGYIDHQTHIVLAEQLYPNRLEGDEPEPIEVIPWPISRLEQLMARDDFSEARSIAALYLARERLDNGGA